MIRPEKLCLAVVKNPYLFVIIHAISAQYRATGGSGQDLQGIYRIKAALKPFF